MAADFFDNLRDYSEIKLRILGRFLAPWAAKLGSSATRGNGIIWYVDGFAGRGQYQDGRAGSPLLRMKRAETIRSDDRAYRLSCFFVEKNRNNWKSLEELAIPFRDRGLNLQNRCGEFASLIPEIVESTAASPVLLFVDPFGISPLKYSSFQMLLKRRWPLDLILTFQHRALHRLVKDHPALITEAIGTARWEKPWRTTSDPNMQTQYVLEILRESMLNDGRFLEVFFYPIRPSIGSAPKYYLLFASRHHDAFELWNDQVSVEEDNLSAKQYGNLARQASYLPAFDQDVRALKLLNEVRRVARSLGEFTRQDLVMYFVQNSWGQYQTKQVRKAVGSLVASGEMDRDRSSGNSIDTDNMRFN